MTINITSPHKPHRRKTMIVSIAKLICFKLVLIGLGGQLIDSLPTKMIAPCIEEFNETFLPIGGDTFEGQVSVEGLGRVIGLPASNGYIFKPSKMGTIKAKFDIITRKGRMKQLEFQYMPRPLEQLVIELCNMNAKYPFNFSKLTEAKFDASRRTVIIIGGYLTLDDYDWFPKTLSDSWLSMQDLNIIVATWRSSNQASYQNAVANSPYVARQINILLYYLAQMNGIQLVSERGKQFLHNIHIIGHSCGAHIGAFMAKDLAGLVGRISGLDPAGPFFDEFEDKFRLDKSDAKLVDVYHSNAGKINSRTMYCSLVLDAYGGPDWLCPADNLGVDADPLRPGSWFGIDKPIGHVDIYLNNGHKQPGCFDRSHICDHKSANKLLGDYLLSKAEILKLPSSPEFQPLAFREPDYDSFRVAKTFRGHKNCSWIMHDLEAGRESGELASCSIEIDFMKPPSDYRRQLEQLNGVDLSEENKEPNKYYMATLPNNPILPMHYFLLKLKLAEPRYGETLQSQWGENCRLNAQLNFLNPPYQIPMKNLRIDSSDLDQMVLAFPFNHPRGLDMILNDDLKESLGNVQDANWLEEKKHDLRGQVFPSKLEMSSSYLPNTQCQMEFTYVIIEPLWTNAKSFYGQFVINEKYNARLNDSLSMIQLHQWTQNRYENIHLIMSDEPLDLVLKTIIIDD